MLKKLSKYVRRLLLRETLPSNVHNNTRAEIWSKEKILRCDYWKHRQLFRTTQSIKARTMNDSFQRSMNGRTPTVVRAWGIAIICFCIQVRPLVCLSNSASPAHTAVLSSDVLAKIRSAVRLSKQTSNVTASQESCGLFQDILYDRNIPGKHRDVLPEQIRATCLALYASALVRCGRDDVAITIFDQALAFKNHLNAESQLDVGIQKAYSMQRLLRYQDARDEFLTQSSTEPGAIGAATMSMRLGNITDSAAILRKFVSESSPKNRCEKAKEMICVLEFLIVGQFEASNVDQQASGLLHRWICSIARKGPIAEPSRKERTSHESFIDLVKINQSPFDDPGLIHLDDKVLLHNLIRRSMAKNKQTAKFWPESYIVLTGDCTPLDTIHGASNDSMLWFLKARSGYGSHGNQIVTMKDDCNLRESNEDLKNVRLLQRMVHPPMLLDGKKFSLRIYAICFGAGADLSVFISSEGLVKLASKSYNRTAVQDGSVHMTNSGRDASMVQKDLSFLASFIDGGQESYDSLWNQIKESTRSVLEAYRRDPIATGDSLAHTQAILGGLGLPKILGLDFVVDSSHKPWLIEVNRFPGLEPRDEDGDRQVKHSIVRSAWEMAARRMELGVHPFRDTMSAFNCKSGDQILERL